MTKLPHGTSLYELEAPLPDLTEVAEKDGLRLFSLESALVEASPRYFLHHATDARAAMAMIRDTSDLLARLLDSGHSTIAGLAGAFRNGGRSTLADEIMHTMSAAGYAVRETDPFTDRPDVALSFRESSPYANRIRIMWQKMRDPVIESFPEAPGLPRNPAAYIKRVGEAYVTDAWHSLSIEGYRVTPELIRRVRIGTWNPDANEQDREQRNAMAARGYWQAFQSRRKALVRC